MVIFRRTVPKLSEQALERFLLRARRVLRLGGSVNVLVTNSAELRILNRRFRGKDSSTDVLSFPADRDLRFFAGDIAISAPIAAENARRLGHPLAEEIKILALHGLLHLAGYDHERDNGQMARKEAALRQQLRLPAGLIERAEDSGALPTGTGRELRSTLRNRAKRRRSR
jgi:probable rRNA maturation factor